MAEMRKAGREEVVLQSLASKQPQKITGRQAFFAQCVDAMKATVGPEQREATAKRVMQRHAIVFRMLLAEAQEEYEARAQAMALERRVALAKEAEAVLAARLERGHQARAQASMAAALSLSSCRLSATDLATMAGMWSSPEFSAAKVSVLREQALQGPSLPTSEQMRRLEAPSGTFEANPATAAYLRTSSFSCPKPWM